MPDEENHPAILGQIQAREGRSNEEYARELSENLQGPELGVLWLMGTDTMYLCRRRDVEVSDGE